jgi:hypothetical protein
MRFFRSLALTMSVLLGLTVATARLSAGGTGAKNALGLELSYVLPPTWDSDPYSGPLGLGVFYERHSLVAGLFAGARLTGFGFYPLRGAFGDSFMVMPTVSVGYDFVLPVDRRFALALSPYVLGGLYWRRFLFSGQEFDARRPVIAGGLRSDLRLGRRLLVGLNLEVILVLDQTALVTFSQGERMGVRF